MSDETVVTLDSAAAPTAGLSLPSLPPAATAPRRGPGRNISMIVASSMLALIAAMIVVAPFLPFYDPYAQDLMQSQKRPFSPGHLLGTDTLGRDILSRLALAGRVSILIAFAVVIIGLLIGVTLGLIAGYFGGKVDFAIMGLADLQITIPFLLLLIAVIAAIGPSISTLVLVLGVTSWVRYGRLARIIASSVRSREFVLASITHGASDRWIIIRHVLGSVVPQLVVMATFEVGVMVTAEASLSYLGLGVQAPTPSWGSMIAEGQRYLQTNAYLCIVPGIAVFLLLGGLAILGQHFSGVYGKLDSAGLFGKTK